MRPMLALLVLLSPLAPLWAQDTTPPAAVNDLRITPSPLTGYFPYGLKWFATGDDGMVGTAAAYDIRYTRTGTISETNWFTLLQAPNDLAPREPGEGEECLAPGQPYLLPGRSYQFALKVLDEAGNASPISNVVTISIPLEADGMPPSAINTLQVVSADSGGFTASWRAPGDDGTFSGPAASYDLRYSSRPITPENFAQAVQVQGEPVPGNPWALDSMTFMTVVIAPEIYFAITSADDQGNVSGLSNVAYVDLDDDTPPADVTDLGVVRVNNGFDFHWSPPGDDGVHGQALFYDLRWSLDPITEKSWEAAAPMSGEPAPRLPGSYGESWLVPLSAFPPGAIYHFALKTTDDAGNVSGLSNGATLDLVAPAQVTDLRVAGATATSITLRLTAPGDDGFDGRAWRFMLLHSTSPFTPPNLPFDAVGTYPEPVDGGTGLEVTVTGLAQGTTHYFTFYAVDESLNWSAFSAVIQGRTRGRPAPGPEPAPGP